MANRSDRTVRTELVNGDAHLIARIDAAPVTPFDFNFVECHCEKCDPLNGYTDGRECTKGHIAEPGGDQ